MYKWPSLSDYFNELNKDCSYVILRNYEDFEDTNHLDIDFLCESREEFIKCCKSISRTNNPDDLIHQQINVDGTLIPIDIRVIGDGYYDSRWEESILNDKVLFNGVYVPSKEDYLYSLIYHVLIHKNKVSDDYKDKLRRLSSGLDLDNLSNILNEYMKAKGYKYTYPETVYTTFNTKQVDKNLIEKDFNKKLKRDIYKLKNKIKGN